MKGVSNLIQVKTGVSADLITLVIDEALRRSAEGGAQLNRVSVDGSLVTLSGQVGSCREQKEAERAVWAVSGVNRVANLVVVAP